MKRVKQEISAEPKPNVQRVVGVIASTAALVRAASLRRPPDLFELRLDALRGSLGKVARTLPALRAPLILTARHPVEGGRGDLSASARRDLLQRFIAQAAYIDLELRCAHEMKSLREQMRRRGLGLLLSVHHLGDTPSVEELLRSARSAFACKPALLKIATRTQTAAQLNRLVAFFQAVQPKCPIAAMGLGRLGLESRKQLGRLGSALVYVSLDKANAAGQPSLSELRRARSAYII